jgi:alkyl sulfatase BDS1-like metallo-beta-lactamase superfamily hydrolase
MPHQIRQNAGVVRYLSLEWLEALSSEIADDSTVVDAAIGHRLDVTQVITGGPEGDVMYHLHVENNEVVFGPGPAEDEDARFTQSWETAVAVATGQLPAQDAFIKGRIKLTGDQQRLIDAQPVFAALDPVFNRVRERTVYE